MRTLTVTLAILAALFLGYVAYSTGGTAQCEALYNEYSATVDMPTREAIFQNGLDSGCFHYN